MPITTHWDDDQSLWLFIVMGPLSADEAVQAIDRCFADRPSPLAIWDLLNAELEHLEPEALARLARQAALYAKARGNPETILIVGTGANDRLVQLFRTIAPDAGNRIPYHIVNTFDEADGLVARLSESGSG